eukprot:2697234-Rhodomonas_salina.1
MESFLQDARRAGGGGAGGGGGGAGGGGAGAGGRGRTREEGERERGEAQKQGAAEGGTEGSEQPMVRQSDASVSSGLGSGKGRVMSNVFEDGSPKPGRGWHADEDEDDEDDDDADAEDEEDRKENEKEREQNKQEQSQQEDLLRRERLAMKQLSIERIDMSDFDRKPSLKRMLGLSEADDGFRRRHPAADMLASDRVRAPPPDSRERCRSLSLDLSTLDSRSRSCRP